MSPLNPTDARYRAWLAYRALTAEGRDCAQDRSDLAVAEGAESLRITRVECTVSEDWIAAIEAGLIHIEKAIREDRQFIYSNGEVIPVEKVKQVSKDSVEHLARHAELISRVEEGKDIIPDKLYTVERLSDYAVYENRFLYMLLCYLRDFVTLRYRKILELTGRYEGSMTLTREAVLRGRRLSVRMELRDERTDDPYLLAHNAAGDCIDRMDLILKTVQAFLATPLMESAGKAAMLKPPITKTNVLKMDNNFKGAVALYDYIIAYEGDGYTVHEVSREISPFGESLREDTAEAVLLLAHLTYRYGLEMTPTLKTALERDENQRRLEELRSRADGLESLRRRLEREGESAEVYAMELERLTRALRRELDKLDSLYGELDGSKQQCLSLQEHIRGLDDRIRGFDEELAAADARRDEAVREAEQGFNGERLALREAQAARLRAVEAEAEAERTRHREETEALRTELARKQAELDRFATAYDELNDETVLLRAQVLGQRARARGVTPAELESLTEEERFNELERELEAFTKLYGRVWRRTKRKIRRDLLNPKYIKGQCGKK